MNYNVKSAPPPSMQHAETKTRSKRQDNSDRSIWLNSAGTVLDSCAGFMTLTISHGYGCATSEIYFCAIILKHTAWMVESLSIVSHKPLGVQFREQRCVLHQ